MATTLRLNASEEDVLARLAGASRTSKQLAAASAVELTASQAAHPEFVDRATRRLLEQYSALMDRLAAA